LYWHKGSIPIPAGESIFAAARKVNASRAFAAFTNQKPNPVKNMS
jgi:hypothetical protein